MQLERSATYPQPVSVMATDRAFGDESLADLLGGLIETGVVLQADVTLSLAGIDLVYVGLKAVICSADAPPARAALGLLPEPS